MSINDFSLVLLYGCSILVFRSSFHARILQALFVYDIISCAVFAQTTRRSFCVECSKASIIIVLESLQNSYFSDIFYFIACVNVLCNKCICHFGVNLISNLITRWRVSWCWHSSLSVSVKKRALWYLKGFFCVLRSFFENIRFLYS